MQRKQKVNKSLEVSDEVKHSFQHRSLFYSDVEYEAPFVFLTLDCRIQRKEKSNVLGKGLSLNFDTSLLRKLHMYFNNYTDFNR